MCVPYSFLVTKEGDIISKQNVEHHSDLCKEFGLDYDAVLKPDFHIWDKKVTDVSDRLSLVSSDDKMVPFYEARLSDTDFTVQEYWLKNKFHNRIQSHIQEKFKTWKHGLEFIEQNWNICKRYVPKLVSKPITFEMNKALLDKTINDIEKDFDTKSCFTIRNNINSVNDSIYGIEYKHDDSTVFKCEIKVSYNALLESSCIDGYLRDRLKTEARLSVAKQVVTDKYITTDVFKDHWSKEENRVECWRN